MWSVPPPTIKAAKEYLEADTIAHTTDFPKAIIDALSAFPGALIHTLPPESKFPELPKKYLTLAHGTAQVTDGYLLTALHRARLVKDESEIERIRKANAISSRAHEVVMRVLGNGVRGIELGKGAGVDRPLLPGEWLIEKEAEAEAIFVASCRREGYELLLLFWLMLTFCVVNRRAVHQAYLPIVAASTRASTLHYCCNDKEFAWGPVKPHDHKNRNDFAHGKGKELNPQVLLIDAGCEWDCYASDSTYIIIISWDYSFETQIISCSHSNHARRQRWQVYS